jgi:hypothetical protein
MGFPSRAMGLLILALCGGCAHTEKPPAAIPNPTLPQHVRNNSASLLNDLLNEEKHLSKVLLVKRESDELQRLVERISAAAGRGAKQLEQLAKTNATLQLTVAGLPPGEAAARAAIAKTKQRALLQSSGTEFELNLLLTQIEALNYGAHLADVAALNDSTPANAAVFGNISRGLKGLYAEVVARLRRLPQATSPK